MAEKSKTNLLKDFHQEKTPEEKKKIRLVLLFLFGLTTILIALAVVYRELPGLIREMSDFTTVVTQDFPEKPTAIPTPRFNDLKDRVEQILVPLRGNYGIYFQSLETSESFSINGRESFTAASLIKLPVMLTLYREADAGRINLDDAYSLKESDRTNGAGPLQYKPSGYQITYREMSQLMGEQSDNTAFTIVSRLLGEEKIQATIDALGMKNTSFDKNMTTPEDIGLFFERLYRGRVVTDKSKEEILSFLTKTIWEDRIPAGIPKEIKVSHKIGTEIRVISDAGIVFSDSPFILAILSQNVNEIEAKKALPEITATIYELSQNMGD
ncbi:class A beta-lactamase-related serine hydrolase [Patescibacteria group bacterium]|nr:class A beta-lactamase-related serine hydrolase [Patescibacteria group bacterium]